MEGLFSLLLFGVFFYVMMRFGCGSHGSHGQGQPHNKRAEVDHIDPVCGVNVKQDEGYGKMVEGRLTRFCSKSCLDQFEENPSRYIQQEV